MPVVFTFQIGSWCSSGSGPFGFFCSDTNARPGFYRPIWKCHLVSESGAVHARWAQDQFRYDLFLRDGAVQVQENGGRGQGGSCHRHTIQNLGGYGALHAHAKKGRSKKRRRGSPGKRTDAGLL